MAVDSALTDVTISAPRRGRFPAGALLSDALGTTRGRIGASLVLLVMLIALLGPLFAPHSPTALSNASVPFEAPNAHFLLGTDFLGRDVLSRVLHGGWLLLLAALAATCLGVGLGTGVGVLAAFEGGWVEAILLRAMDVLLAFPSLVLALLLVSLAGPSLGLIIAAVALSHMPQVARVVYSASLDVCERDFMASAELVALPRRKMLLSELVPNLSSLLMVEFGLRMTFSIVLMAGLSFLGLGFQPPAANWGTMINENRIGMTSNPWAVLAPVLMIALLTVGLNTFTDAIARAAIGVGGGSRRSRVFRFTRPRMRSPRLSDGVEA
jgi:peptide/nickel transport system permease protein